MLKFDSFKARVFVSCGEREGEDTSYIAAQAVFAGLEMANGPLSIMAPKKKFEVELDEEELDDLIKHLTKLKGELEEQRKKYGLKPMSELVAIIKAKVEARIEAEKAAQMAPPKAEA